MALGTLEIGLSDSEIQQVQSILGLFPHIEEVFLFGSRARGDYKRGSDIDLSIKGEELTREDLSHQNEILPDLGEKFRYHHMHLPRCGVRQPAPQNSLSLFVRVDLLEFDIFPDRIIDPLFGCLRGFVNLHIAFAAVRRSPGIGTASRTGLCKPALFFHFAAQTADTVTEHKNRRSDQ